MNSSDEIPSPCINVCKLDAKGRHCSGCGRSLSEITEWSTASAQRKKEILKTSAARPKNLNVQHFQM